MNKVEIRGGEKLEIGTVTKWQVWLPYSKKVVGSRPSWTRRECEGEIRREIGVMMDKQVEKRGA